MRKTISLVLAVLMMLVLLPAVKLNSTASADAATYNKVATTADITDGLYLLVAEASNKAFNGTSADGGNTVDVTIADGAISGDFAANEITIAKVEGGYTLKNSAGKYLSGDSSKNTVVFGDAASVVTIELTDGFAAIQSNSKQLLFNTGGNTFFRFYNPSNATNSSYVVPGLYLKTGGTVEPEPSPSTEPEPSPSAEPVATKTAVLKEGGLDAGDKVVLFYPKENKVMSTEDYFYNNSKHELVALDATLEGDTLSYPEEGTAVLTVKATEGEDEIVRYTFVNADGKFLEADGTHVQFVAEESANTLFQLEAVNTAKTDWFIQCDTAQYNGNPQFIEFYRGAFTVYGKSATADPTIYTYQFYAIGSDEPVVEPTGDTVVLFTNDVHCGIRDGWGYAGLADLKKTLEAEGNEVILVDAGDHVQGAAIGSLTQGEAIIDIMNEVGYDLATLGNHEFDYGMDQAFKLIEQAKYPYVSANFVQVDGNKPVLDAYQIIEANGKNIAFVGISTPESITKSTPTYFMNEDNTAYVYGFCQDATGEGVYTAVQNAIDAAKADGADVVILVGHMGIDEQSQPWTAPEVIANTTGAVAFIDGHSHSVIDTTVPDKEGTPVLHGQTGTKLANVGKLTIAADGTLDLEILPASEKVKDDPEVDAYIANIEKEFNELLNTVVAHTDHDLTILDPDTGNRAVRSKETNLGDLCADAYQHMFDADIAFVNGGGVRANINTGDITFNDIISVHPFGNTAVLAEVTGQQILDALEHGAASNPGESGGFLQVAGLKYEIHNYLPANEIVGSDKMWQSNAGLDEYRVKNVQVKNKETGKYEPLDLTKTYTLASHNYMLMDMGDGYAMFGANIKVLNDSGIADNKVLIDYIQSMPEVDGVHQVTGYTDPRGEGRIKIYSEPVEATGDTIILFTNDVHCGIRDGWGYAGLADLKKTLEEEGNEVILVDAGDHVQGGPIGSLTQGEAIIDIMNEVGYDLATLGNHEFDYGMDQMFALTEQADYPYVSANFMDLEKNAPAFDAYKIIEANGKKIAFVGISTPESITKSTPTYFMNEDNTAYVYGFCQDATGEGVYTAVQNAIDAAKADGADVVILVGHMGIDEQSQPWTAPEVIANTTGAVAFIDGHSHSVIDTTVPDKEGTPVLHGQTGTKLANVGKLTIAADGTLDLEILPASEKVKDDPEVDAYIANIEKEFNELLNTVVAHTDHDLTILDPDTGARAVRSKETNLGDLCADAYRTMFDADIAFVNGGGVRANINTGDITFQQIINVHPFGNTAVLAEVTGQQILDALEHGAASNPGESGGFLQVAGLKYEIHNYLPANEIVGSDKMWQSNAGLDEYRVKNVQVKNKETGKYEPLDLTKTYTLASHNYMLMDMGDGYAMFGANIKVLNDSGIADNKVLIDYIQSMPEVDGVHQVTGYTDPRGEGRITIVSERTAVIYGEEVKSADIATFENGRTYYNYDIKIKGIDPETEVCGIQAFVEYDPEILTFVDATSVLEGSTGINTVDNKLLFAWASNGAGIKVEDGTVIVTLTFELAKAVADGEVTEIKFTTGTADATSGYSYASDSIVVEAKNVETEDGSITFEVPSELTLVADDVTAVEAQLEENGEILYRYNIKVQDLPEGGLMVNSAQIFLTYDKELLTFVKAEGALDFEVTDKGTKLMAVWASDSEVLLKNDDAVLTLYFKQTDRIPLGTTVDIAFTENILGLTSSLSFVIGGKVVDIEATTVDGRLAFEGLLGDANCDGVVSAADAATILRSLVNLVELTAQGAINADVDGDGAVTAADASAILRYIVKLIEVFPVEEEQP